MLTVGQITGMMCLRALFWVMVWHTWHIDNTTRAFSRSSATNHILLVWSSSQAASPFTAAQIAFWRCIDLATSTHTMESPHIATKTTNLKTWNKHECLRDRRPLQRLAIGKVVKLADTLNTLVTIVICCSCASIHSIYKLHWIQQRLSDCKGRCMRAKHILSEIYCIRLQCNRDKQGARWNYTALNFNRQSSPQTTIAAQLCISTMENDQVCLQCALNGRLNASLTALLKKGSPRRPLRPPQVRGDQCVLNQIFLSTSGLRLT